MIVSVCGGSVLLLLGCLATTERSHAFGARVLSPPPKHRSRPASDLMLAVLLIQYRASGGLLSLSEGWSSQPAKAGVYAATQRGANALGGCVHR